MSDSGDTAGAGRVFSFAMLCDCGTLEKEMPMSPALTVILAWIVIMILFVLIILASPGDRP